MGWQQEGVPHLSEVQLPSRVPLQHALIPPTRSRAQGSSPLQPSLCARGALLPLGSQIY